VGKSAQLPLQTWLPDAMAGPSPVSALIHAATMVTAGVYLLSRMHVVFELSPLVMQTIAVIGAATLLVAGLSALAQRDIKRVLAYSTISQVGYMFLALGVGAWSAAVFHFMIHAFFKALLFLGAGAVIASLHHEHDMFKMGGLRKQLPVTFLTFLIASASLAALPIITAGFYSKDQILWFSWSSELGSPWLWFTGLLGAFITAVYTFRMVFLTFFGEARQQVTHTPGWKIKVPLVILGFLSLCGGFIELPHTLGNLHLFSGFTERTLPGVQVSEAAASSEWILQLVAALAAVGGVGVAYWAFFRKPDNALQVQESTWAGFLLRGWNFDRLYATVFVNPVVWLSGINKNDFINRIYDGIGRLASMVHKMLSRTQNGKIRWYAMGIVIGAVLTLTIVILL